MYIYIYIYTYIYIYIYVCICIYIYIYAYMGSTVPAPDDRFAACSRSSRGSRADTCFGFRFVVLETIFGFILVVSGSNFGFRLLDFLKVHYMCVHMCVYTYICT